MKCRLLLVLILVPVLARSAPAGIFFGKKANKPNPNERVPELINQVMSDGDENKRVRAAEELRQYDPASFPYIVPVLVTVLINDKKPVVRAEAAHSLGKIRPISQEAGLALEQAQTKDPSMRVRLQARSSLLQYHWAGYKSSGIAQSPLVQTKEPPLADNPALVPGVAPAPLTPSGGSVPFAPPPGGRLQPVPITPIPATPTPIVPVPSAPIPAGSYQTYPAPTVPPLNTAPAPPPVTVPVAPPVQEPPLVPNSGGPQL
jgi:hypothetical protein